MDSESERDEVSADANEVQTDALRAKTIPALFEAQASVAPNAIAIEFEDRRLTYGQLNEQVSRVACRLRRLGIDRGMLVGLCMERSPELIVGLLGILKAGGAYVPLEPDYPDSRLSFMIRDSGTQVIAAHKATASRLAPSLRQAKVLWIDGDDGVVTDDGANDLEVELTARDLACVHYTSGPTGSPLGVMIDHSSVLHLVRNIDHWQLGSDNVFLQLAPISSDSSTFEILGALLNGGRLAMMPPGSAGLGELGRAIRRHGVTSLWLASGLFNLMAEQSRDDLRPLRHVFAAGDVLSPRHVQRALDVMQDGAIHSVYGHVETTSLACCYRIKTGCNIDDAFPIGHPTAGTRVHVLDEDLRPVPPGATGEMWIGGNGLARGYLNHSGLTRQKFLRDPFSTEPGARMYRTGDLGRNRADGNIELKGRLDTQVQILGQRIEPGEIEAALRRHPEVRQTVVVGRALPHGEQRLVAYIVAAGPWNIAAAELKDYLARRLPRYMVPSVFVTIDSLPLSPNGKVDRSALPPPEQLDYRDGVSPLLITEIERSAIERGSLARRSPSLAAI